MCRYSRPQHAFRQVRPGDEPFDAGGSSSVAGESGISRDRQVRIALGGPLLGLSGENPLIDRRGGEQVLMLTVGHGSTAIHHQHAGNGRQ